MGDTEEKAQEASLELYKSQLSQVTQAIQAAGESEDLRQLENDLKELIKLTQDNLLDIKKAKLLKSLEPVDIDTEKDVDKSSSLNKEDDEYAAFKKAIGESPERQTKSTEPTHVKLETHSSNTTYQADDEKRGMDEEGSDGDLSEAVQANMMELIGTKCRAPFSQDWGHLHYCNAMIWSVDPPSPDDEINDHKVHVIFINPTHRSMIPCEYFMDGACRFSDEECRYSHGHPVCVSELQAYVEPDHSKIAEGCRCLAKNVDGVWYQATVLEMSSHNQVQIEYDVTKEMRAVMLEHVIPIDGDSDVDSSSCTSSEDEEEAPSTSHHDAQSFKTNDSDDELEVPVYLWKPAKTTERLGAWETHTRGIGSKLMAKMGYITGQGLGRHGEGRAEPVPILLLPQGKSLDKIMQLKEMSGNADLFNAMKQLEKRQKILEKKEAEKEKRKEQRESDGVFGFLNKKLADERDRRHHHHHHHKHAHPRLHGNSDGPSSSGTEDRVKQTNEKELTQRSDSDVNLQIFRTAEEMRTVERKLSHLRQQLSRNEDRDRKMADNVRQKISEQESYLNKLKTSSQTLERHKTRRKDHKKLTIF